MEPGRETRRASAWTPRLLALACVLLAMMCVGLAAAWTRKAEEAACWREALRDGETPSIAQTDCGG